ncbi:hypothetical protein HYW84_00585, partial [Candidatus Peregrinibacteria bacterium]|nr:hypothetical protein [Candidatus Peregrinibacteria bacterium]
RFLRLHRVEQISQSHKSCAFFGQSRDMLLERGQHSVLTHFVMQDGKRVMFCTIFRSLPSVQYYPMLLQAL